ncbi:hypothetical protein PoB_002565300 [Plakobranchus ocellatus]|uniref:Uncharacterized protein n=1 Tax=Plakobranchus ocellatus TaxID=259542 RepID=A0AAV3ZXH3_9GAST|nr:hypothetical protein PoB_002565300 [Plakobranchus ocellatus]
MLLHKNGRPSSPGPGNVINEETTPGFLFLSLDSAVMILTARFGPLTIPSLSINISKYSLTSLTIPSPYPHAIPLPSLTIPSPSLTIPHHPLTIPNYPSASLTITTPHHPSLSSPPLTIPDYPSPSLIIPDYPSPSLTTPDYPSPSLTIPDYSSPSPHHT